MAALLSALAIPAAKTALEYSAAAVSAVRQPFAAVLQAAADCCRSADSAAPAADEAAADEGGALTDRLAERLEQLLADAGALPGEHFQITVGADGAIEVRGREPAASVAQSTIADDAQLESDLLDLAQQDDQPDDARWPFELDVEIQFLGGVMVSLPS